MIAQMLRFSVLLAIWKKYRRHLTGALVLLAFWLVVNIVHQDFIEYSHLSQGKEEALGWSYLLKWVANLLGLAIYLWLIREPVKQNSVGLDPLTSLNLRSGRTEPKPKSPKGVDPAADPFAEIRQKDRLRSKADIVIDDVKGKR